MEEEQTTPWRLDSYLELAFDGLTGSEYWMPVPCAYNAQTDEKLTLTELIPILNALERRMALVVDATHMQHIRQALESSASIELQLPEKEDAKEALTQQFGYLPHSCVNIR